ncbi:MAG: hypothetical protein ABSA84_03320 [Gammaproteobacteria bacterium]|jgi:hypothetical protein
MITTILIPANANRAPTERDYNLLKSDVVSALHYFYLHEGIMMTFIENDIDSVAKIYCYLKNKIENTIYLNQEEQTIYSNLMTLKDFDVNLDKFVTRIPIIPATLPRLRSTI